MLSQPIKGQTTHEVNRENQREQTPLGYHSTHAARRLRTVSRLQSEAVSVESEAVLKAVPKLLTGPLTKGLQPFGSRGLRTTSDQTVAEK